MDSALVWNFGIATVALCVWMAVGVAVFAPLDKDGSLSQWHVTFSWPCRVLFWLFWPIAAFVHHRRQRHGHGQGDAA